MSDYTTNLNLLKKNPTTDGNDYFNIQTMLNDNWDKIDVAVASKETSAGAQAKVDNLAGAGRTTQTVKANADAITTLNQTVTSQSAEIIQLQNEVRNSIPVGTLSLSSSAPVASIDAKVNGGLNFEFEASPLLVNLLGSDGRNYSKWNIGLSTGLNYTSTLTAGSVNTNLEANTEYTIYFKVTTNNSTTVATVGVESDAFATATMITLKALAVGETGVFKVKKTTKGVIDFNRIRLRVVGISAGDTVVLHDIMVIKGDYTAIDIPYVNGIQPMLGFDIKVCGKNLIDYRRLTNVGVGSNTLCKVDIDGYLVFDNRVNTATRASGSFPVYLKKNGNYTCQRHDVTTFSGTGEVSGYGVHDKDGVQLASVPINTPISPATLAYDGLYYIRPYSSVAVETYQRMRLTLVEGDVIIAYEPYQAAELLLDGEFAGIGTYLDKVIYVNGIAKALRRVKKVVIDGNIIFAFASDHAGFKTIVKNDFIPDNSTIYRLSKCSKYDGKILTFDDTSTYGDAYVLYSDTGHLYFKIFDTDSGWGETYTPLAAEMTAFMNGWKMNNGTFGTPYNGSGTKTWTKWNATDNIGAVTTLPTVKADGWTAWATLWYVIVTPYEESIPAPINGLTVFTGKCTLNIQTGIVEERANIAIKNDGTAYGLNIINATSYPNCPQTYKVAKVIDILKNGVSDIANWIIDTNTIYGYGGKTHAYILKANYAPKAIYRVKYEVLPEEYNSQQVSITAEYTENLLGSHNELVKMVSKVQDDVAGIEWSLKDISLGHRVGSFTRLTTLATGTQTITGLGFKPKTVVFMATVAAGVGRMSIGFSDLLRSFDIADYYNNTSNSWTASDGYVIQIRQGSTTAYQYLGTVASFDEDGFTISWTKGISAVDAETITIYYLALR